MTDKDIEIYDVDVPAPAMLLLNGNVITEQDALDAVDEILENLNETSDLSGVNSTIQSLLGMQRISGKSLAKILWGTMRWWKAYGEEELTGDTFEDYIYANHGLKPITTHRYINVWDKYEMGLIPKNIQGRPLKDQIAIASTLNGYEISKTDWKRLERANNNNEVLAILRDIKGKPPRKSSLQLYEERDGNITAWKNGQRRHVAWFNSAEEDDEIVREALARLRRDDVIRR